VKKNITFGNFPGFEYACVSAKSIR